MKTMLVCIALMFVGSAFAKDKEMPVTVHIIRVEMRSSTDSVRGGGTYGVGNGTTYSIPVTGGDSYTWHLMVATIDGHQYTLKVRRGRHSNWLHVGDYSGRWDRGNRALEAAFADDKGKERIEQLKVLSEE